MELPFWILLVPYIIFLFIFALWLSLNIYHLVRFGFFDFTGKMTLFLFGSLSLITIIFTFLILSGTVWTDTFNLLDIPGAIIPLPDKGTSNAIQ